MTKTKRIKGIGGGTLHGELSEQAAYNALNYLVQTIYAKEGFDVELVRISDLGKEEE
jgi:hypothetical protein